MKGLLVTMATGILIVASCSKNNDVVNSTDVQNINSESVSDAFTYETSDMCNTVLSNVTDTQLGSAPVSGAIQNLGSDPRLTGAVISVAGTGGKDSPQGTITIDYKSGAIDGNGVRRKGLITIAYNGRRWAEGSSRTISYSGYSRSNVVFYDSMTYRITNLSPDSTATPLNFHHTLVGGKLTFPDQTSIVRNADFNAAINFVAKTTTLSGNGAAHSATGTMRAGADFVMDITTPLLYETQCIASKVFLPVGGKKSITAGSSTYTVDYGDGLTCDKTITATVGGKSATISVNSDGN
jgi:hypothetical protein